MFRSEALFVDRQRPAHQRLRLGEAVRGLEQGGQVVEVSGDVGVFRSEALFVDRQRPAHQRLRLGEAVRGLEQQGEVVEAYGNVGVFRSEALFVDRQRPALQRLRLGPLCQLMECSTEPAQQNRVFTSQRHGFSERIGRGTILRLLVLGGTQVT